MIRMVELKREIKILKREITKAINNILESGQFIEGSTVKELEKRIEKFLGVNHAITLASGTDSLFFALKAANVGGDSEVITTAFSFIATAEAIVHAGAKPVFADIDYNTMTIDPKSIEKKVTDKTKALIVVHIFGNPCKLDEIIKISQKYNLFLIEDCAQSFGAKFNNQFTGTFGDFGCFSFFPTKNLGCYGDGGLIVTNCDKSAYNIRILKNHGSQKKYEHSIVGYNSRLDSIQAAILNVKLKYLNTWNSIRKRIAYEYTNKLSQIEAQQTYESAEHIYHQYTFKHFNRLALMEYLKSMRVESTIYYPIPIHRQKAFQNPHTNTTLPETEKLSERVLSIPIHPFLDESEVSYIIKVINSFKG
jgi:dTDP-4-amino-4,6-dideoxygalactose transaminase